MTQNYTEKIKDAFIVKGSLSYHGLFPLMKSLKSSADIRAFMEGYVEVSEEFIKLKLKNNISDIALNGVKKNIKDGKWTLKDSGRHLASDNLAFLANTYEANTNRKRPKDWDKVLEEVCFPF